jgi:hypothetical protein
MNSVARRIAVLCIAASAAAAAAASEPRQASETAGRPAAAKDGEAPARADRLDPRVVERETSRRSAPKPKAPVMPAERG